MAKLAGIFFCCITQKLPSRSESNERVCPHPSQIAQCFQPVLRDMIFMLELIKRSDMETRSV